MATSFNDREEGRSFDLAWTRDGRSILTLSAERRFGGGSGTFRWRDARSGEALFERAVAGASDLELLPRSADGNTLLLGVGAGAFVVARYEGGVVRSRELRLVPEGMSYTSITLAPGGDRVAIALDDARIQVVDVRTGDVVATHTITAPLGPAGAPGPATVRDIAFSPDGRQLLVTAFGAPLRAFAADAPGPGVGWTGSDDASAMRWLADDALLLDRGTDGVELWRYPEGRHVATLPGAYLQNVEPLSGLPGRAIARGLADTRRTLWDLRAGEEVMQLVGPEDEDAAFVAASADGGLLFLVTSRWLRVLDLETGAILDQVALPPGYHSAQRLHPDGRRVQVFREDGAVFERAILAVDQDLVDRAREAARSLPAPGRTGG
jgi:WD40 repeat protein